MPSTAVKIRSPGSVSQSAKPAQATIANAPPSWTVRVSLPWSMKRPILTANTIGRIAKAAVMTPSQMTDSPSSTAR